MSARPTSDRETSPRAHTPGAARLRVRGLHRSFGPSPILRGIDLELRAGEVHALVGENGAGKSTLARILCGYLAADAGTLELDGAPYRPRDRQAACALGVRLVRQELGTIGNLSVAENLLLDELPAWTRWGLLDRARMRQRARELLARMGLADLDPDLPAGTLGIGTRQAIEIAAALHHPCRLLVLDEPTAALSAHESERLFRCIDELRGQGSTVLYVSHRLEELRRICDRVTVLRDGLLVETLDARAADPEQLVARMAGTTAVARATTARAGRAPGATPVPASATPALELRGLCAPPAVRDVSLRAHAGEILGLAGLVGAGRSETLRALFGADPLRAGEVRLFGRPVRLRSPRQAVRAGLALVGEDRKHAGLLLPLPVRANLGLARLPALRGRGLRRPLVDPARERAETDAMASALDVRTHDLDQPIAQLSGGNQQKALLARALSTRPRILLLDEPTRGIDVAARRGIAAELRRLAASGMTLVVASSDLEELLGLCDRITVLARGRSVATFARADFDPAAILAAAFDTPTESPA